MPALAPLTGSFIAGIITVTIHRIKKKLNILRFIRFLALNSFEGKDDFILSHVPNQGSKLDDIGLGFTAIGIRHNC